MNPLIQLIDVIYRAGNKTILNIPKFELHTGEFLGIMGPNGAGKSTLLKLLSFLENHSSGQILYRGEKMEADSVSLQTRRRFSVAMQQSLLLDTSVFQNIALGLKLRNYPKKEIRDKTEMWLERFQITHLSRKNAQLLSGGEAQRVNLARAMIVEPEILFLDEPFSALDFPTKIKLMEDFKEITVQTGTTSVFISHDLTEIQYLTTKLAVMMKGEIKQEGVTGKVLEQPNLSTSSFLNEWKKFYYIS